MKKKNLINILLVCCCLHSINLVSQTCPGGIAGAITTAEVNARVRLFAAKAKFVSRKNISTHPLLINVTEMKNMLQDFYDNDSKNKYDGIRVYFILPEKEIGDSSSFSLLFVPTIPTAEPEECSARNRSQDDDSNAYYFSKAALKKVDLASSTDESFYVLKRRLAYGDIAAKTPRGIGKVFEESQSTWYSKEVFFKEGVLPDMLSYLKQCSSVTDIEIYFASFLEKTVPADCERIQHKTHPIFRLVGASFTNSFFTLASAEIKKNNKKRKRPLALNATYSDTGLPCPPNKCN